MARAGMWNERPNIASVSDGYTYYTLDTMETHLAQGGKWHVVGAGGAILAASAFKSAVYAPSDASVEVPALSTTFTGGNRPVEISFSSDFANSQVGGETTVRVSLNGTDIMILRNSATMAEKWETVSRSVVVPVTNGTQYTVKVRLERTWGSGTARISGSTKEVNQLTVRQG